MAENEKQLKITSIFDTRGSEKVQKVTDDLRKIYDLLSRSIKETTKALGDLETVSNRTSTNLAKQNDVIKQQADRLRELRQAHLGVISATTGAGAQAGARGYTGMPDMSRGRGYGDESTYGRIPPSQRGFSAGVDTSPYAQRYMPTSPWATVGKVAGVAGAVFGAAATGMNAYGNYLERHGESIIREKTQPLSNLAEASSYRNHIFMGSVSGPVGYSAYRAAHNFDLKTKETGQTTVDQFGQTIQPDKAGLRGYMGNELTARAMNMTGEAEVQRGHWWQTAAGVGKGLAVAAGGAVAVAGAGAMIAGTAGLGAIPGLAVGAAGATAIVSGLTDVTKAIWATYKEGEKNTRGKIEAQQSGMGVMSDKMKDEILAITRYQMGVFNNLAPTMAGVGRQSLGGFYAAQGMATGRGFDLGEASSMVTAARRGFGRIFGDSAMGRKNLDMLGGAADRGMGAGAATEVIGAFGIQGKDGGAQLQRIMQVAVKSGMESLDMGFFEKLAVAGARGSYSSGTGRIGTGIAAMLFAGGRPRDQHDVQESIGGVAAGDRLFRDNNYFKYRSLVSASRILGSAATGKQTRGLGWATMGELLGGEKSERLMALGITPGQMAAQRDARLGAVGDILSGDAQANKFIAGRSMPVYLQNLAGRLKNKKTHDSAYKELNVLAASFSDTTGENFGDMRGWLKGAGVSDADLNDMSSGKGGTPAAFKSLGGRGARVVAAKNQEQARSLRGGIEASEDVDAARKMMENTEFTAYLARNGGQKLINKWGDKKTETGSWAGDVNTKFEAFSQHAAIKSGEGYDSAQKLSASLDNFNKMLDGDVQQSLRDFVKEMKDAATEISESRRTMQLERAQGF